MCFAAQQPDKCWGTPPIYKSHWWNYIGSELRKLGTTRQEQKSSWHERLGHGASETFLNHRCVSFWRDLRMCQRRDTRYGALSTNFQLSFGRTSPLKCQPGPSSDSVDSVYDAWLFSRAMPGHKTAYLVPGSQRTFNKTNIILAYIIIKNCTLNLFRLLWNLHPIRTSTMLSLNVIRSLFPAFRGYSQALIIDEVGLHHSAQNHS
jgi:hypothetical protein